MQKAIKKYGEDCKTPAESLEPADKKGWLTKQGGSVKTWKKRWCVLKGKTMYYYKGQKDAFYVGRVDFEPQSMVKEEVSSKKRLNLFSISTSKRVFFMYPENPAAMKEWIDCVTLAIERSKGNNLSSSASASSAGAAQPAGGAQVGGAAVERRADASQDASQPVVSQPVVSQPAATPVPGQAGPVAPTTSGLALSPRNKLDTARETIPFLREKVLEFWKIWFDSIPIREELTKGNPCEFFLGTSVDMQKLTWRVSGPQNAFIQKMVDFFWNVGAPESEIDRLNDVGAEVNPTRIGSWIDMSSKGGMDGGWYFPVDIPLAKLLWTADDGAAISKFEQWCNANQVTAGLSVGRDMGAAPPRQTELRLQLPGATYEAQLEKGLNAAAEFGFPDFPPLVLEVMKQPGQPGLVLSVITSSEGFVRMGLLCPHPTAQACEALIAAGGGNTATLAALQASLGTQGPEHVEYQYLMPGFGYGVYKEGYDTVLHFNVGTEEGA